MTEKVSKDVKRIRKFEQSLLTHYQLFLKHLDKILHSAWPAICCCCCPEQPPSLTPADGT